MLILPMVGVFQRVLAAILRLVRKPVAKRRRRRTMLQINPPLKRTRKGKRPAMNLTNAAPNPKARRVARRLKNKKTRSR
jgi:hypothetical protein